MPSKNPASKRTAASPAISERSSRMSPVISVVIPVYNEEAGLASLFARLYPALDALGDGYELILVDDGSRDRSARLLGEQFQRRPDVDRKSTRLNSSHVSISYAVFCLKKKNRNATHYPSPYEVTIPTPFYYESWNIIAQSHSIAE